MRNLQSVLLWVIVGTSFAQNNHFNSYLNQQYQQPATLLDSMHTIYHPEGGYNNPCRYSSDPQCTERATVPTKAGPNEQCPQSYGSFRNNLDNGKFIRCIEYLPYYFECPAGTIYDHSNHRCDYRNKVYNYDG
ncbi:uncharacterized protein LOC106655316 [Trichogramma pretiosum]|uniref:uncharacterized protein LOC106655316 n=1 Tax=Trichogramma pretiosum TaxID=7493 RepID=UPI0006C95003|nr:uncharacterized protein LOC106655316 [Trichogramma pretiosum]